MKKSSGILAGLMTVTGALILFFTRDRTHFGKGCPLNGSSVCTGCGYCDRNKQQ